MLYVKIILRILSFTLIVIMPISAVHASDQLAKALGWQTVSTKQYPNDLCGGHFTQPKAISSVPHPASYQKVPITVTAKGPVIFRKSGASVLQKDVIITQPGRRIHGCGEHVE